MLGNDTDIDGQPLTAMLVSGPAHGTLTLNANGSYSYQPAPNYSGPDSFTYRASDGTATSATRHREPHRDAGERCAASRRDDAFATNEDSTLQVGAPGVLANDSDVEASPITAELVSGPAHGTLTLNADGSFTYVPDGQLQRRRQLHLPRVRTGPPCRTSAP